MEPVRSLRELFSALSGGPSGAESDPAAMLAAEGHGDLPGPLMAEAIVNYADTAPVEVAEHLSGYVMAHSAVPGVDPGPETVEDGGAADGLALLSSAPDPVPAGEDHDATIPDAAPEVAPDLHLAGAPQEVTHDTAADLDFGHGHDQAGADAPLPVADQEGAYTAVDPGTDWTTDQIQLVDTGVPAEAHGGWDTGGDHHSPSHEVEVQDHDPTDGLPGDDGV